MIITFLSLLICLLSGCVDSNTIVNGVDQSVLMPFKITLPLILAFIVGIYELIARLVPTVGQYALIGKIIDILKWVSDFFNRKKPTKLYKL
jgi:hypothetical protein